MELPATAEVIIIGGGVMGASSAYHRASLPMFKRFENETGISLRSGKITGSAGFRPGAWTRIGNMSICKRLSSAFRYWKKPADARVSAGMAS
jgi:glycine/D-amino acid oxidase-like deaminating enzyme